ASYAKESVTSMQKAGIINGVKATDGSYSFMPKNNATRAEAAKMIYQMTK
ncbi:MAG: S-layer homology domain-containing protein, partial [Aminipila sp.]